MRPSSVNADDMLDLNNLEEPKTIKFVNGFPPKKLKAKRVVEKEGKGVTFELMQLNEEAPAAQIKYPIPPLAKGRTRLTKSQNSGSVVMLPRRSDNKWIRPNERKEFAPNALKSKREVNKLITNRNQISFSLPPTVTELRSLTRKFDRYYPVSHRKSRSCSPFRVRGPHDIILDIEKALSEQDVAGLEACYKRVCQGDPSTLRTLLDHRRKNQERRKFRSSPPLTIKSVSTLRRESSDSEPSKPEEAKPVALVPAPFFRGSSKIARHNEKEQQKTGPVMFSTSLYNRSYLNIGNVTQPNTAIVMLDVNKIPSSTARRGSEQGHPANGMKRPLAKKTCEQSSTYYKNIVSKSSSTWIPGVPQCTPEPHSRLHVDIHQSRQSQPKDSCNDRSKFSIVDDKGGVGKDKSRISHDKSRINYDNLRCEQNGAAFTVASVRYHYLTDDNNVGSRSKKPNVNKTLFLSNSENNKPKLEPHPSRRESLETEHENFSSDEDSGFNLQQSLLKSNEVTALTESRSQISDKKDFSRIEGDELTELFNDAESRSTRQKNLKAFHNDSFTEVKTGMSEQFDTKLLEDLNLKTSDEHLTQTNLVENIDEMEDANVVLVSVTTDEGQNVGADIYKAEQKDEKPKTEDTADVLTAAKETARKRKEELAALLQEHSSIVKEIENLSSVE